MTELSFATTVDEESEESNDDSEDIEWLENETGDLYISLKDGKAAAGAALQNMEAPKGASYTENDGSLSFLKIYGSDDLEDAGRLLEEYEDAEPQQKLHMMYALAASTFGAMQGNKNGHGIGLNNEGQPATESKTPSYADHYRNLEVINWKSLSKGERDLFESIGVDASELGFDPEHRGPKLLVSGGKRVPVVATEGGEAEEFLSILATLPEAPSYHEDKEEELVESSAPSVFDDSSGEGGAVEEVDMNLEGGDDPKDEDLNLASNPERITEATTSQLKSGVNNLTNITNSRVLMKMKSHEENSEDPRSSVIDRLDQRISAEARYGDGEEDEESETNEDVEITLEDINEMFGFNEIEQCALENKVNNGMSPKDAARQIADV